VIANTWSEEDEELLEQASELSHAVLTRASSLYEISLPGLSANEAFDSPITVSIALDEQTKLDLLGIYLLGDDGSLQYLGGKVTDGRMEAKLPRPGKIIVLSYDRTFDDVS